MYSWRAICQGGMSLPVVDVNFFVERMLLAGRLAGRLAGGRA